MSTSSAQPICPGCSGSKIQVNKDGLKVICPCCGGTGVYPPQVTW